MVCSSAAPAGAQDTAPPAGARGPAPPAGARDTTPPAGARDTAAPTEQQLAVWGEQLAGGDGEARREALQRLSTLGRGAVPAIRGRIESLRLHLLDADVARKALASIRHETGSRRADDMIDILPGVLPRLEQERTRVVVMMAEALCLLRSLEAIATMEAGRAMADLFGTQYEPWKWESRRVVHRMGPALLPVLVEARGHDRPGARRWSRWGVGQLDLEEPGKAVRKLAALGPKPLADLLRAYGEVRDMDAMPVVVTFVDSEQRIVRRAARGAVDDYGRNVIWQLRRAYRIHVGEDASRAWSTDETARRLYEHVDEQRLAPAREHLRAGLAALERGELQAMRDRFEQVLREAPELPQRGRMAPGWAALAERRAEQGERAAAIAGWDRALALAPGHEQADDWRAARAFTQAERRRAQGLLDLEGYRRTLALEPGHAVAEGRLDVLSGARAARERRERELATWAAAAGLALLGLLLLWRHRRSTGHAQEHDAVQPVSAAARGAEPEVAEGLEHAGEAHDTLPGVSAPDTLPGV